MVTVKELSLGVNLKCQDCVEGLKQAYPEYMKELMDNFFDLLSLETSDAKKQHYKDKNMDMID
jgi:hypothetical protein